MDSPILYESKTTKIVGYQATVTKTVKSHNGYLPLEGLRELVVFNAMRYCSHPYLHLSRVCTITPETITFTLPRAYSTLSSILPTLPKDCIEAFCSQLYAGINHLHRLGFIHRDIHPNNILYWRPVNDVTIGHLEIADFSSSTMLVNPAFTPLKGDTYSLLYRPPEILIGACYDANADLWAMGCVMAEMFLNTPLFKPKEYDNRGMLDTILDVLGGPLGESERLFFELKTGRKIPEHKSMWPWLNEITLVSINSACIIRKLLSIESWKRGYLRYSNFTFISEYCESCPQAVKSQLFAVAQQLSLDVSTLWTALMLVSQWAVNHPVGAKDIIVCIWIASRVRKEEQPEIELFQSLSSLSDDDFYRLELDIVATCSQMLSIPCPLEVAYILNPSLPQFDTFSKFFNLLADSNIDLSSTEVFVSLLQ